MRRAIPLYAALLWCITPCKVRAQIAQKPKPPQGELNARIDSLKVVLHFPLAYNNVKTPNPPVVGRFAWRVSAEGDDALSLVLAADTAMHSNDIASIVRASTLRMCTTSTPIRECREPVRGKVKVSNFQIQVEITDPRVMHTFLTKYPASYWRYEYEPGGRYRLDKMKFEYALEVENGRHRGENR